MPISSIVASTPRANASAEQPLCSLPPIVFELTGNEGSQRDVIAKARERLDVARLPSVPELRGQSANAPQSEWHPAFSKRQKGLLQEIDRSLTLFAELRPASSTSSTKYDHFWRQVATYSAGGLNAVEGAAPNPKLPLDFWRRWQRETPRLKVYLTKKQPALLKLLPFIHAASKGAYFVGAADWLNVKAAIFCHRVEGAPGFVACIDALVSRKPLVIHAMKKADVAPQGALFEPKRLRAQTANVYAPTPQAPGYPFSQVPRAMAGQLAPGNMTLDWQPFFQAYAAYQFAVRHYAATQWQWMASDAVHPMMPLPFSMPQMNPSEYFCPAPAMPVQSTPFGQWPTSAPLTWGPQAGAHPSSLEAMLQQVNFAIAALQNAPARGTFAQLDQNE